MQSVIRAAHAGDAAALSRLMSGAIRYSNAADYPPEVIARLLEHHAPDAVAAMIATRRVFVAKVDGRIVGTVALEGRMLRGLFVAVEHQGRGIALAMVTHVEDLARTKGIAALGLQSSVTAHGFYEKLGYRTQAFRYHPEGSTYRMIKRIAPNESPST